MATEPPRTLTEHFADAPVAEHGARWNACWETATTPWDRGGPSLALADLLEEQQQQQPGGAEPPLFFFPEAETGAEDQKPRRRRRTALVPGCGRGHDVLLLASFGFDVVGLDISDRAVAEARKNAAAVAADDHAAYPLRGPAGRRGRVVFLVGDFFNDAFVREAGVAGGRFDFIFDYTVRTVPRRTVNGHVAG